MAEIVVAGQTFEIKGDQPTPQEQVAIDTFLQARNLDDEKTGIQDIDNGQVFITPEDILTDAVSLTLSVHIDWYAGLPTIFNTFWGTLKRQYPISHWVFNNR